MKKVIQVHTGFMGKIFYRISRANYTNKTLVSEYNSGRLFKEEAEGNYKELRYFFEENSSDKTVSLRGFITKPGTFSIKSVKSNNKKNGLLFTELWPFVEQDLKKSGIEKICSRALPKMIPLVYRLGFNLKNNRKIRNKPRKKCMKLFSFFRSFIPPYVYEIEKEI